jgi:hypothetical protein
MPNNNTPSDQEKVQDLPAASKDKTESAGQPQETKSEATNDTSSNTEASKEMVAEAPLTATSSESGDGVEKEAEPKEAEVSNQVELDTKQPKAEEPKSEEPKSEDIKTEEPKRGDGKQDAAELVKEIKEVAEGLKEVTEETSEVPRQAQETSKEQQTKPTDKAEENNEQEGTTTVDPIVNKEKKNPFRFMKSLFSKKKSSNAEEGNASLKQTSSKKPVALIVIGVVFGLLAALGLTVYVLAAPVVESGKKSLALIQEVSALVKTQDLVATEVKVKEAKTSLEQTRQMYQRLGFIKFTPFVSKYYLDGEAALNAGLAGLEAGEIGLGAVIPYADILGLEGEGSFTGGTAEDRIVTIVETLDMITPGLAEIGTKLTQVKAELSRIDPLDYPEEFRGQAVRSNLIKARQMIDEVELIIVDARPLIEVLPAVLGHPEPKKYLVLFQNDGELRPTGGFMSAFAILNVDKGRVTSERSDDIYSLDAKFNQRVEAPEIISKYLNEKSWKLRNMNLSPDYKLSMDTFKGYYDTLPGEPEIDGVIAIDTKVLEEIVTVIGPVEVPGFGVFTVENDPRCNLPQIVCELEHIVDKPLATLVANRKSSIMGPMMQVIMQKSLGGEKEVLAELLPLMLRLMEEKHIMVYFEDETAQAGAEAFNIAGRIQSFEGDYLHINNANFGGAKSNFYIEELVEQTVEIKDDGTIQKKLEISYTHTQPMDNCNLEAGQLCLSGIQRNYFRVYVPKGSQLVEGLGSEVEIKANEEGDKTYFDGFFNLRPESRVKVMLIYTLPFKAEAGQDYRLLIQKQPGTSNNTYVFRMGSIEEEFILNKDIKKSWKI